VGKERWGRLHHIAWEYGHFQLVFVEVPQLEPHPSYREGHLFSNCRPVRMLCVQHEAHVSRPLEVESFDSDVSWTFQNVSCKTFWFYFLKIRYVMEILCENLFSLCINIGVHRGVVLRWVMRKRVWDAERAQLAQIGSNSGLLRRWDRNHGVLQNKLYFLTSWAYVNIFRNNLLRGTILC
jgi:hypothetical protein